MDAVHPLGIKGRNPIIRVIFHNCLLYEDGLPDDDSERRIGAGTGRAICVLVDIGLSF